MNNNPQIQSTDDSDPSVPSTLVSYPIKTLEDLKLQIKEDWEKINMEVELDIGRIPILKEFVSHLTKCIVKVPNEASKIEVIKDKILERRHNVTKTLMVVRARDGARMLQKALTEYEYSVRAYEGARNEEHRDILIKEFKNGDIQVMILGDVLAEGFDKLCIPDLGCTRYPDVI
ncbi:hypothetical protein OSB04_026307 [Centaurea solstitialis]|uniref:Helicase C-terminal domain-containing protein n=1 Tax=Centaurea solstitialis TaxID=347529 RepID=A0AA38SNQ9_9ASTR|nr:hypothetical protein OSB04_026307 [Centaurea solstitialis]